MSLNVTGHFLSHLGRGPQVWPVTIARGNSETSAAAARNPGRCLA